MIHFFRIIFCCFLSMIFILELFMWLLGFGADWPMLAVSFICLVVLTGYTVYDVLNMVDDLDVYMEEYKQCKKELAELEENYDYACEEIKGLNYYIKEDSREIVRLRKLLGYYQNRGRETWLILKLRKSWYI